jgi:hypothetical protein
MFGRRLNPDGSPEGFSWRGGVGKYYGKGKPGLSLRAVLDRESKSGSRCFVYHQVCA